MLRRRIRCGEDGQWTDVTLTVPVDELPMTATGKFQKLRMRVIAAETLEKER